MCETIQELLDVLKLTANNLRSLGPAGAIKQYVVWLKTVEDAIEDAIGKADCNGKGTCEDWELK